MSVKQIDPQQTQAILQQDKSSVYIDVRTAEEFANGHVPGAVNIPAMLPDPVSRRMTPNPDFVGAVQANYAKDKKIIFVCAVGQRSALAAEMAAAAGLPADRLFNLEGGTDAWRKAGEPVE